MLKFISPAFLVALSLSIPAGMTDAQCADETKEQLQDRLKTLSAQNQDLTEKAELQKQIADQERIQAKKKEEVEHPSGGTLKKETNRILNQAKNLF